MLSVQMAKKLSIVSNEKLPYSKQHTNADTFYNIKIRNPLKSFYDFFCTSSELENKSLARNE